MKTCIICNRELTEKNTSTALPKRCKDCYNHWAGLVNMSRMPYE